MVLDPKGPSAKTLSDTIILSILVMGVILLVVYILYAYMLIKYRASKMAEDYEPPHEEGNKTLEIIWTIIPVIIVIFLSIVTVRTTSERGGGGGPPPPPDLIISEIKTIVKTSMSITSRKTLLFTASGEITEEAPSTNKILKILLPTMFPRAISLCFLVQRNFFSNGFTFYF
ncbi:hypothetical protein BTO30_09025 [Domibacillus antri]|uniref:Cytochrome oxidase subunit II transmembrane region profile domain-containing protein n=1 Tax=Domibacillus antri TaxID=1714264 RepID=A0A1Q8Q512_9BACI|nr:hypothetical protein BTO30_09025 [Domibacillus antri]